MKGQYIQIYKESSNSKMNMLIEDEGNIIPLDGRKSVSTCCREAVDLCRKNNFKGFRIMWRGEVTSKTGTYNTFRLLSDCWKVFKNTVEC